VSLREGAMLYTTTLYFGTFPVIAALLPLFCLIIIQMIKEKRDERERA
jgi:hypothetical protein